MPSLSIKMYIPSKMLHVRVFFCQNAATKPQAARSEVKLPSRETNISHPFEDNFTFHKMGYGFVPRRVPYITLRPEHVDFLLPAFASVPFGCKKNRPTAPNTKTKVRHCVKTSMATLGKNGKPPWQTLRIRKFPPEKNPRRSTFRPNRRGWTVRELSRWKKFPSSGRVNEPV